jgi:hypothetical protein
MTTKASKTVPSAKVSGPNQKSSSKLGLIGGTKQKRSDFNL